MSKSRGTFIKASTGLNHFDADSLRYYYTAKLSSRIDDRSTEDFVQRVNADIVNKVVNRPPVTLALSISVLTVCWQASWLTRSCTKPSLMPLKRLVKRGKAANLVKQCAKLWRWLTG